MIMLSKCRVLSRCLRSTNGAVVISVVDVRRLWMGANLLLLMNVLDISKSAKVSRLTMILIRDNFKTSMRLLSKRNILDINDIAKVSRLTMILLMRKRTDLNRVLLSQEELDIVEINRRKNM